MFFQGLVPFSAIAEKGSLVHQINPAPDSVGDLPSRRSPSEEGKGGCPHEVGSSEAIVKQHF